MSSEYDGLENNRDSVGLFRRETEETKALDRGRARHSIAASWHADKLTRWRSESASITNKARAKLSREQIISLLYIPLGNLWAPSSEHWALVAPLCLCVYFVTARSDQIKIYNAVINPLNPNDWQTQGKRCHRGAIMRWWEICLVSITGVTSVASHAYCNSQSWAPYFRMHWSFFVFDGYSARFYLGAKTSWAMSSLFLCLQCIIHAPDVREQYSNSCFNLKGHDIYI